MDAIQLFLHNHARTHSSAMTEMRGNVPFEDVIFGRLSDEQIRIRPAKRVNSLVWLLWHMARTEDVNINVILSSGPQVLEEGGWLPRLNVDRADMGAGMTDGEVGDFTSRVNIEALRAYRAAVGRRTREVALAMRPEELDEPVDMGNVRRAFELGAIAPGAAWIEGFLAGKPKAFVLGHAASGHSFLHLGEAMCIRSLAGFGLPV